MKTKKLIVIIFSAALGISFLFIGFGSYVGKTYVLKVGNQKISSIEFSRAYENYKSENSLSNLSEQEELFSKVQFTNQYVNELVFINYLDEKISISDNSKKVVLKKSLNNDEMFRNLDEASLQNYLKEIEGNIYIDLFNNSLDAQSLVDNEINPELLIEKELNIYEIKKNNGLINYQLEEEFYTDNELYEITIKEISLRNYILEEIISDAIIENYYNENITTFIEPKNYTYEQIILENDRNESFVELKNSNNSQFKLFEDVNEKLILPQVLDNLKKLNVGDESESIKIGEKFFYVKLLSFKDEYQVNLKDAYEDIMNTLTQLEIENFEMTDEIKNIDSYSTNQTFFSNSFNFLENIPDQYNFINFNQSSGEIKKDNFLFQFNVKKLFKEDLPIDIKEKFLISFSNYKKNIDTSHGDELLNKTGTVKVNYFTDSLTIKNNFIEAEDLERIVIIKNDEKLKVVLPNEVIYLDINSIGSIDSLNIKQNIVNLIYSNIIKQIKNNIDIEVDNEKLIQL
ncbi:peptidylprolyl isomerase [Alphaproteobacteria bacterium]|nr:peptidylprolyl isomerase [Alphaproteobacteria bacterium]